MIGPHRSLILLSSALHLGATLSAFAGIDVVRLDRRIDAVWNRNQGYLLYSDIPANTIYRWTPGTQPLPFIKSSGYSGSVPFGGREPGSNGLAYDVNGRLVICQHGDRRIVRVERNGARTVLADRYLGRRLNSPNDAVFRSNGDLYFTDPPFGLPHAFDDPGRELAFSGVYRLSADGELSVIINNIRAPNGIAFSPDESILYVTDVSSDRPAWLAYDVLPDGRAANGRVFVDARPFTERLPGGPDGLKVDVQGNLFGAGPGGVYVFAPDGAHLGTLETGVPTANVAFGEDGSVLFVAASTAIYRIELSTRGAGFGP
jgi:gluconolactonase